MLTLKVHSSNVVFDSHVDMSSTSCLYPTVLSHSGFTQAVRYLIHTSAYPWRVAYILQHSHLSDLSTLTTRLPTNTRVPSTLYTTYQDSQPYYKMKWTTNKPNTMTLWVEGMIPKSRMEGVNILYNEPSHNFDHRDESTWPPKYVDLSSSWVYTIVKNEAITARIRHVYWPNTFGTNLGLHWTWQNKGNAPKVFDAKRKTWNYPVVFNSLQLHGEEGERAGLDATKYVMGKPHRMHEITIGRVCLLTNNPIINLDAPQADMGTQQNFNYPVNLAQANAQANMNRSFLSRKRSIEWVAEENERVKKGPTSTSCDDATKLPPAFLQADVATRETFSRAPNPYVAAQPFGLPPGFSHAPDPYVAAQPFGLSPDPFPAMSTNSPRMKKVSENGPSLSLKREDASEEVSSPGCHPAIQEMIAYANMPVTQKRVTDPNVPVMQEKGLEIHGVSDSGSNHDSEDNNGLSWKSELVTEQGVELDILRKNSATAKQDINAIHDDALQLETKLKNADEKLMMMTAVINSSFNMLDQLGKSVKAGVTLAKTFLKEHGKMTEEEQKRFEQIKRESDQVVESTKMATSSVEELNDKSDWLETWFPHSIRILADSQGIHEWRAESALGGENAVEEGDHWLDHEERVLEGMEDGSP